MKSSGNPAAVARVHEQLKETAAGKAWAAVAEAGGTPAMALRAAKSASGRTDLVYMPHQGARERARRLKRMAQRQQGDAA